jgi:hypothetical protein
MEARVLLGASGGFNKINEFKRGSRGRMARNPRGHRGQIKAAARRQGTPAWNLLQTKSGLRQSRPETA